jgi:hypothetical protein
MEITLEKVELIKDRTGVSYKEAKEALEAADGNVVDAIISIEETINMSAQSKLTEQGAQMVERVKDLVKRGNIARIVVKRDDDVLLNLPVSIGVAGVVLAPFAILAGIIAAFGTKCAIELIKDDGDVININAKAEDTFNDVKSKGSDIAGAVLEKGTAAYGTMRDKAQEAMSKSRRASRVKVDDFKDTVDEMWEEARNKVKTAREEAWDGAEESETAEATPQEATWEAPEAAPQGQTWGSAEPAPQQEPWGSTSGWKDDQPE